MKKKLFALAVCLMMILGAAVCLAEGETFGIDVVSGGQAIARLHMLCVDSEGNPLELDAWSGESCTITQGYSYNICIYHNMAAHDGYTVSRYYVEGDGGQTELTHVAQSASRGWLIRGGNSYSWENPPADAIDAQGNLTVRMELKRIVSPLKNNPAHSDISLTLFDYGSYINVGADKDLLFGHNTRVYEGIDGQPVYRNHTNGYGKKLNGAAPLMKMTLVDGLPETRQGVSYGYLFRMDGPALYTGEAPVPLTSYDRLRQETVYDAGFGYTSPYESMRFEMEGDGGLFYEDEDGYLVYDCSELSAFYNTKTNRFEFGSVMLYPGHVSYATVKSSPVYGMNFVPFDRVGSGSELAAFPFSARKLYRMPYSTTEDERSGVSNMFFGMCLEFDFYMPEDGKINGRDMVFQFGGDDDVWCYVDDVLVLDIGGCHGATYGSINFSSGRVLDPNVSGNHSSKVRTLRKTFEDSGVSTALFDGDTFAPYTRHTVKFFYLERGGNISFCRLRFNTPMLPQKSLTVRKQLEPHENSGVVNLVKNALSYEFRVLQTDADGNPTDKLFVRPGTKYSVIRDQQVVREDTVDADGVFRLKADESAQFRDMWTIAENTGAAGYVVEERLPSELAGTYGAVEYIVDGSTNVVTGEDGGQAAFTTFRTAELDPHQTQMVLYSNKVQTTVPLRITKQETGEAFTDWQESYAVQVLVGGMDDAQSSLQPITEGTVYTVNGRERAAGADGVIELKTGETAVLRLLSGTKYKVQELADPAYSYYDSYTLNGAATGTDFALGTILPSQTEAANVTIINTYYDPAHPPETGDSAMPLMWLLGAALALCVLMRLRRPGRA